MLRRLDTIVEENDDLSVVDSVVRPFVLRPKAKLKKGNCGYLERRR